MKRFGPRSASAFFVGISIVGAIAAAPILSTRGRVPEEVFSRHAALPSRTLQDCSTSVG